MSLLENYKWETTHVAVIAGVVTFTALVAHLFGTPRGEAPTQNVSPALAKLMSSSSAVTAPSPPAVQGVPYRGSAVTEKSDPRETTVGPRDISARYRLLTVERKSVSAKSDELIIKLHVESLAMEGQVSPFESDMFEITAPGSQLIPPGSPFYSSIPSGTSRNQDIAFNVPAGMRLDQAALRIHYYSYQGEIPLNVFPERGVK
jgi:hypothetical protein